MADLSITAGNVVPASNAVVERATAGAAITAGQVVYLDTSDNKMKLADADAATAAARTPRGIALCGASDGQPIVIQRSGDITIGATVTAGTAYYLSAANAGGIAPVGDLTSGDYYSLIGVAKSASALTLALIYTGASV